ncbi:hypothetical protein DL770_007994 [Monosporascus sp. CRB-9-2]|nr:hypothetical protein DL770_007994 [Monosporascus sp. CRB-9-2]
MRGIRASSMTDHNPGTESRHRGDGDSRDAKQGDDLDLMDGGVLADTYEAPTGRSTSRTPTAGAAEHRQRQRAQPQAELLGLQDPDTWGGWVREPLVTDLPSSYDIVGAQQHLPKGSIRELHRHHVYDVATVRVGDIWYFPEGVPHTIQGLEGENITEEDEDLV